MKQDFIHDNFILQNKTAEYLYHQFAKKMPIIDYHSHLIPEQIAENKQFENITQIWLYGDHYKWRAMRTNGVKELFCTGKATDWEKFEKWAETVPHTLRNPLYHWTHLELKRYFGISKLLNPSSAREIFNETSQFLQQEDFKVQSLIKKMNVEIVCTTDDPTDNLAAHDKIAQTVTDFKVLPTWRPDKAMMVENVDLYNQYIDKLSVTVDFEIQNYADLITALKKRHDFFHSKGCRLSDHGIENFYAEEYTQSEINQIFEKIRSRKELNNTEILKFKSATLHDFALLDAEKNWVQQFHAGALRNNNSRLFKQLGADTGFDSIGDFSIAQPMAKFLNRLDEQNQLAKTILYNLNPSDNEVFATMIGNFQDGSVAGKIQYGSGWWFLDQKDGMQKQINALSNLGLLSRFVGMLTDSRSFLSYPRHEYFRRILCNLIGNDVENGEIPNDMELLGSMIENICYYNAKNYFNF